MDLYGAVELGGTKTLAAVGDGSGALEDVIRIDTGDDPGSVAAAVVEHLAGRGLTALGIASFGPLQLRLDRPAYGSMLSTPKPGWAGHDLVGSIGGPLGIPVVVDTDVNGAALAEGLWGACRGVANHVYITVGTGIGGGIVIGGDLVHGLSHSEMGHVAVSRHPDDDFAGSCPYHGDCLEGMAAGPAVVARFGAPGDALDTDARVAATALVTYYLAQGIRALIYLVSPQRVVVGGGVSQIPGFHDALHSRLLEQMAGYGVQPEHVRSDFVVPPGLGDRSGLAGALALAAGRSAAV